MNFTAELELRVRQYAQRNHLHLGQQLGYGMHGIVFVAESQPGIGGVVLRSAIKVHRRELEYQRERDVYIRLRERGVATIRSCEVPQLLRHDDDLWIIEMTLVKRPFVLDFAGAYLDKAPDFSDEVWADWQTEKREQFGRRWPEVQAVLRALEGYGIKMLDVNPGNVSFVESDDRPSSS
ncbi:MAG: hypothetical protein JNM56_39400 [Planctomycetia bacterium]|nr:hypothetical protein [Planctomycetia bacterium]